MSEKKFRPQKFVFKLLKLPPQFLYRIGLGPIYGRLVLLLTTTGRKTGKKRVTPLQYEEIDGAIYVASARGKNSDWFRNILADHNVLVQVKNRKFSGWAECSTDPAEIADFLAVRLKRHPVMVKAIMRFEGLPKDYSRSDLEKYAQARAMVIIRPVSES